MAFLPKAFFCLQEEAFLSFERCEHIADVRLELWKDR